MAIRYHYGHKHRIQQVPNNLSLRGLEYEMTPLGNKESQFKVTEKQTVEIGQRLPQCGQMAVGDAWLLFQTRVLVAISYPLALASFTTKQCCRLSVILNNTMLPKLGINRNMKRTVVYSPRCLDGVRYPSFEYMQDSKSITHFLRQLESRGGVATDIKIILSQLQLQL